MPDVTYRGLGWMPEDGAAETEYGHTFWMNNSPTPTNPPIRFWTFAELAKSEGSKKVAQAQFDKGCGDCPFYHADVLFFSERARQVLSRYFDESGEFIPVVTEEGVFSAFKCTIVLDAIDQEKSEIEYFSHGPPRKVHRYSWRPNVIGDTSVFRSRWPPPFAIIVTEDVVQAIEVAGLQGIVATELPSG